MDIISRFMIICSFELKGCCLYSLDKDIPLLRFRKCYVINDSHLLESVILKHASLRVGDILLSYCNTHVTGIKILNCKMLTV